MTISANSPLPNWKKDVTFHGLDFNMDLVYRIDSELSADAGEALNAEISGHWIFHDEVQLAKTLELVSIVRETNQCPKESGNLTDLQLGALLLQALGFWSENKPVTYFDRSKFYLRFLAAYGRVIFRAKLRTKD